LHRREFIAAVGAAAAGAALLPLAVVACSSGSPNVTTPDGPMGSIRGTVVDGAGSPWAVGRIFLLDKTGLNKGVYVDVGAGGTFDFGDVGVGDYQLMYWGANLAHVPEPLPNPVPITVRAATPTVVRFQVDAPDPDDVMDRDINAGDFFFQEQPSGEPNAAVVVKLGMLVCWYNVGTMLHTVSGGPWGDSGPLAHGDNFKWKASQVGTFPYRCNYHGARMLATLTVEA
jgi:plastocyanin